MVACAADVAAKTDRSVRDILRLWRFREDRTSDIERVAGKRKNAQAVSLGMAVNKIGAFEFVYPADSAAKRVWNLATLSMGGYSGATPVDLR